MSSNKRMGVNGNPVPARLLYGENRNRLRRICLEEARGLTASWPDRRALLIVPETSKLEMERDYLAVSPGSTTLMMAEVLSFRRLAWRLLGEVGALPRTPLSATGQTLLLYQVLDRLAPELRVFSGLANRPFFIRQLASLIGDLKRQRISAEQLLRGSSEVVSPALVGKTREIARVMEAYEQALSEKHVQDPDDDLFLLERQLRRLADNPAELRRWPGERLSWLSRTSVWISGFAELRDFTPQEDEIVGLLIRICRQVTVTALADSVPASAVGVEIGTDACWIGRRAAWRLLLRIPGLEIRRIDAPGTPLQQVMAQFINQTGKPARPDGLKLVDAAGLDAECAYICEEIVRLTGQGYRYRDIAVGLADPLSEARLQAFFHMAGIPLFLDRPVPVSGSPLARTVLSLFELVRGGLNRHAVMAYLRAGLAPVEATVADALENEWLARGLLHGNRLFDDRRYGNVGRSDPSVSGMTFREWRDQALVGVRELLERWKGQCTFAERNRDLIDFLRRIDVPEKLARDADRLKASGRADEAVFQVRSWNALVGVLEDLEYLGGDRPTDFEVYRAQVSAGLADARGSVIPSSIDQVSAGSLDRTMQRQAKVLFILDASAGNFPPAGRSEGLLKDLDRQELSQALGQALPSIARHQVFADASLLYTLLTLPQDRLYLVSGVPIRSPLFERLATRWPDSLVKRSDRQAGYPVAGNIAAGARPAGGPAGVSGVPGPGLDCQTTIPREQVRLFFGEPMDMSITLLEQYAVCPFQLYADNLLRLGQRILYEPEPADTGSILHEVIKLAYQQLRSDLRQAGPDGRADCWRKWAERDLQPEIRNWMDQALVRLSETHLSDDGLRAAVRHRLEGTLTLLLSSLMRRGSGERFLPRDLEWRFGRTDGTALLLRLEGNEPVYLRGRIDRVDVADGQFRIIDYKSSPQSLDVAKLWAGLSLQLPLYVAAYAAYDRELVPERIGYQAISPSEWLSKPELGAVGAGDPADGRRDADERAWQKAIDQAMALKYKELTPDQSHRLSAFSMQRARESAGRMMAGLFDVAPRASGDDSPCKYCAFRAFCGVEKPARRIDLSALPPRQKGDGNSNFPRFLRALPGETDR